MSDRLAALFDSYREACGDPEASSAFMPALWDKIEVRRNFLWKLRMYTRGLVSVAAAACLAMAVLVGMPPVSGDEVYTQTYVETLSRANTAETMAYADMVQFEEAGFTR